jgi:hypothetical protein
VYGYSYYAQEWITFLHGANALIGFPLCLAGTGLVLAGWRIWRAAAVCSLALIGSLVGQILSGASAFNPQWIIGGAVLFGVAGLALPTHSSTVLGGIIGGTLAVQMVSLFGIVGTPQLLACAVGFAGAAAWAFANRQRVVVVITSFEGGVLIASGAAVLVSSWPWLHGFFRSMTKHSPVMILFFVLVPTIIGMTLQYADANRCSSKAVRGG